LSASFGTDTVFHQKLRQGADSGTHDGLWRHFALRFSESGNGGADPGVQHLQRFDLLQDGTEICGISFNADDGLVPHGIDASSPVSVDFIDRGMISEVAVGGVSTDGSDAAFISVKEVQLYPQALGSKHILALANNPEVSRPH
jgi:hypothetical protein